MIVKSLASQTSKQFGLFLKNYFHEAPVPVPGKKVQDEAEQKAKIDMEQANELEYVDESQKSEATESANASSGSAGAKPVRNPEREKPKWEDTITNRMLYWSYTPEQKEEVKKALAAGVPKATILTYFYPEVTVEKMSSYRKKH